MPANKSLKRPPFITEPFGARFPCPSQLTRNTSPSAVPKRALCWGRFNAKSKGRFREQQGASGTTCQHSGSSESSSTSRRSRSTSASILRSPRMKGSSLKPLSSADPKAICHSRTITRFLWNSLAGSPRRLPSNTKDNISNQPKQVMHNPSLEPTRRLIRY